MKKRIIHAAGFASAVGGNFIASLKAAAAASAEAGYETIMAFPAEAAGRVWASELREGGYRVSYLPPLRAGTARRSRALAAMLTADRDCLIHSHFTDYDVPAWLAGRMAKARRGRARLVWHLHSDFPIRMTAARRFKDAIKYRVMGSATRVIAVSDVLRARVIAAGMAESAVQTIPNGIDFRRLMNPSRAPRQVLAELGIPPSCPFLLLFGWSPFVKGVDIALDAVAELVRQGKPVVLGIVGTESLGAYVATRFGQTPGWLRLLPPTDRVADLFHAASIFMSASRNEGLPYSVIEAMGCGTPVVLSDIPAMGWARAAPGVSFFPSGDARALADEIRKRLACPADTLREQALASSCFAADRFDVQTWAARLLAVYRERFQADA